MFWGVAFESTTISGQAKKLIRGVMHVRVHHAYTSDKGEEFKRANFPSVAAELKVECVEKRAPAPPGHCRSLRPIPPPARGETRSTAACCNGARPALSAQWRFRSLASILGIRRRGDSRARRARWNRRARLCSSGCRLRPPAPLRNELPFA